MGVQLLLVWDILAPADWGSFGSEVHSAGTDGSHHPETPWASPEKWIYWLIKIGCLIPAARGGFQGPVQLDDKPSSREPFTPEPGWDHRSVLCQSSSPASYPAMIWVFSLCLTGGSLVDLWDGWIFLCGWGPSHLLWKLLPWEMGTIIARDDSCRMMWSKPRDPYSPALSAGIKVRVAEFPLN